MTSTNSDTFFKPSSNVNNEFRKTTNIHKPLITSLLKSDEQVRSHDLSDHNETNDQRLDSNFESLNSDSGNNTGLRRRMRTPPPSANQDDDAKKESSSDDDELLDEIGAMVNGSQSNEKKLNLMEQVILLGLKDKEGYTSFWNDNISTGLRGTLLVELALKQRIRLETKTKMRRRSLNYRKVICIDSTTTGDAIMDEALRHIKENSGLYSVPNWIDFLSGDTWNPINFRFHIRNMRERLAKTLADKGICATQKQNFLIFDMTTHPLADGILKAKLVKKVQSLLLNRWRSDITRFPARSLSILYLAQASDVLDNALTSLGYIDFDLASKHIRELLAVDPEQECQKHDVKMEVLWAVVTTFLK